jgi:hypothetical protein
LRSLHFGTNVMCRMRLRRAQKTNAPVFEGL